jgi:hypothetical protein
VVTKRGILFYCYYFPWWLVQTAYLKNIFHRALQGALGISLWNQGGNTPPKIWEQLLHSVKPIASHIQWLVNIRDSYSEDTRFKYRPECRLSVLVFRGFPQSPVNANTIASFHIPHNTLYTNHPFIWCYNITICALESVSDKLGVHTHIMWIVCQAGTRQNGEKFRNVSEGGKKTLAFNTTDLLAC